MALTVRQRAWLRVVLGMVQTMGAVAALAAYLTQGSGVAVWISSGLAAGALVASRFLFYRRFWWGWDEDRSEKV